MTAEDEIFDEKVNIYDEMPDIHNDDSIYDRAGELWKT